MQTRLDDVPFSRKRRIMNRILTLTLAAAAALAGCSKEDHTIIAGTRESRETNTVDPSTIKLPPAIEASKSYRCKDNSVV